MYRDHQSVGRNKRSALRRNRNALCGLITSTDAAVSAVGRVSPEKAQCAALIAPYIPGGADGVDKVARRPSLTRLRANSAPCPTALARVRFRISPARRNPQAFPTRRACDLQ